MSKSSTITIACALCVGAAHEPYLAATLASVAGVVDLLAVNDNSGLARSSNVETLEASAFAARGALRIERSSFVDFADMRNRAFAQLTAQDPPPDWVLFLDADEVHAAQVNQIGRALLPRLGSRYGNVDAYTYHFFGTFDWITDVARRFAFYRFAPGLRWVNPIHEKIVGLAGEPFVIPYVYHHYGNVGPARDLVRKHLQYHDLGNPVPRPPALEDATLEVYLAKAHAVRPYRGNHPVAAQETIAAMRRAHAGDFAAIDAGFRARRNALDRVAAALRGANETARVQLRWLEHPGAFRDASRAR